MPQDSLTIKYYDEEGNSISLDSLPPDVLRMIDSISSLHQYEPVFEKEKTGDEGFESFIPLFIGILIVLILACGGIWERRQEENERKNNNSFEGDIPTVKSLIYHGSDLRFTDDEMVKVLNKYFPYYRRLGYDGKVKFFQRLKKFISKKVFVIHDESGFKEMPILISASAIQLSFGFDKYLLPHFSHIHVFPEEFIGYHPSLRLLEGNVSGHSINLSWKHFLNGYQLPENGMNTGLHEFAHAYYYQYFETGQQAEKDFIDSFKLFDDCGNKAFAAEKHTGNNLYSDYGLSSFHEFWAESVEIFFERPADMKAMYKDLYGAMCDILNQDPLKDQDGMT